MLALRVSKCRGIAPRIHPASYWFPKFLFFRYLKLCITQYATLRNITSSIRYFALICLPLPRSSAINPCNLAGLISDGNDLYAPKPRLQHTMPPNLTR
uniref:Uncharacterized protein n=1 Tax=Candidatus Kentrum sp. LPFa TaxID=2126335 RepID=A0A450VUI6_9GAMM|nr:MAG: hypothetical protein BECKLPF1236A_GA0070988_1001623 [Candidatus Kentron sp. LPFa]VFK25015.1 MAG: hypothetical protein BECKLPF1236C_GA0070990_1001821 [Candidatus Kentron sp. LPFa]